MNVTNKKWLLIFISLVVLGILIAVAVWMLSGRSDQNPLIPFSAVPIIPSTSSISSTVGVKIYTNTKFGFEFEYPKDWKVKENLYGSPFSKFNLIIIPTNGKYLPDPILVNIVTPDFADRAILGRKNLGASISNINVGGISGTKYKYTEEFPTISIDLPFGEYRMILGAKKQYEDVFNQILATFKFLK